MNRKKNQQTTLLENYGKVKLKQIFKLVVLETPEIILSAFCCISRTKQRNSVIYPELRLVHLGSFYSTRFLRKQPVQPTESRKDCASVGHISGDGH